jgi:hypothetical protein
MKRKSTVLTLSGLLFLATLFGLYVYLTEFYYAWPDYALGIRNGTGDVLREAAVRVFPKGQFEFGILDGPSEAGYEDPPWSLPERFVVSFNDPTGKRCEIGVASGVRKPFKGRLTIVLKKNETGYYAEVERSSLNR